jgi:hypothetical protein
MTADADDLARAKRSTLRVVALASLYVAVVLLMPTTPMIRSAAALVGVWVVFASLIRYAGLHRESPTFTFRRPIPIRFSGSRGRFTLRSRGDGRRVEVRAGAEVIAEAIATDERDELVVDLETVDDTELEALGAAIGEAIEMVAVADEDRPAERPIAGPRSWGRRTRAITGGVLRSIGSRSE